MRTISNHQLRLIQWGGAALLTFIIYLFAVSLACGAPRIFSITSQIFLRDGVRFSLMFFGFSMVMYIMIADLVEYYLWKAGFRDSFVAVKRNPWNGFIEKSPEKIPLDEYKAGIPAQIFFGIPLGLVFSFVCFRYYTPSFCELG